MLSPQIKANMEEINRIVNLLLEKYVQPENGYTNDLIIDYDAVHCHNIYVCMDRYGLKHYSVEILGIEDTTDAQPLCEAMEEELFDRGWASVYVKFGLK